MRIVFAGTPEFAVPSLEALEASPHTVAGVVTPPDRPSGRGRHSRASAVKLAAQAHGVPLAQPERLGSQAGRAALDAWRPDLLVVVAYGDLLPADVLDLPRLGCINVHASLLPRWRGAAPIQRAILAGDRETGVTIMRMEAGLDVGAVLLQRSVAIERDASSGRLHSMLAGIGAAALLDALAGLEAGTLRPQPQPAEGVTYAAKITKAEALIDWRAGAPAIERQVRAFDPWPVAETRLGGEPLRVLDARALASEAGGGRGGAADSLALAPGTVVELTGEAIVVACGAGRLAITRLQ
ncbi:MAG: methionyl-tRNA formyltransferase, partial [Steroidobacteraceae bacterium]